MFWFAAKFLYLAWENLYIYIEDDESKDNKALNDQGKGEGTNCHSPTQPQNKLELDLIMGRNPPPPPRNF